MKTVIRVPALGYSLTEFTVLDLPEVGELVTTSEAVITIESDKSVHDVHSSFSGIVVEVLAKVGEILPVGAVLVVVDSDQSSPELPNPQSIDISDDIQISHHTDCAWVLRPVQTPHLDDMWNIWFESQRLASRDTQIRESAALKKAFMRMIESGLAPPFSVRCALNGNRVDGWAGVFPTKNNPLSRDKIGEVSLYVRDPTAAHTPAILLMNHLISDAREAGMAFLLGMSNPNNLPVQKLLKATDFQLLGSAGKLQTQIWVFNL